jgi:single-stranded DNA-specific DHH superfamily exonuclease
MSLTPRNEISILSSVITIDLEKLARSHVLDPKRDDCNYPYDELCGCGIGFKLIQALGLKQGQTVEDLTSYLDLVAAAIAADIVPMTGETASSPTLVYK